MFSEKYKIFIFCLISPIIFSGPVSSRFIGTGYSGTGIKYNGIRTGVGYWILLIVPAVMGLAYLFLKLIKLCCPEFANYICISRTEGNAWDLLPCYRRETQGQSPVHPPNGHNNCYFVPNGHRYETQWTYTQPQPGFVYPNPNRGH